MSVVIKNVRWPNLTSRFATLFARAVEDGAIDLADRLAGVTVLLQQAEALGCSTLLAFLDDAERSELANLETRELARPSGVDVRKLAETFERVLLEHRHLPGEGRDAVPAYVPSFA